MSSSNITAIVLTYNESMHIERCISKAMEFVDEVIVIDSYSTDETVELAKNLGATVLQNRWVNHSVQFNWGLDNAPIRTEWVIRIDADEYLEGEPNYLVETVRHLPITVSGVTLKRKYYFLGKWMRRGGMYPISTLRLFRFGKGRVEDRWMDEHIVVSEGDIQDIDLDIVDDNLNSLSWWVDKHNAYATKEMLEMLNVEYGFMSSGVNNQSQASSQASTKRWLKNVVYNRIPLFVRPILYFLYRYFLRLGFLDGQKGFAFHFLQGLWYRVLVDAKIMEANHLINRQSDRQTGALRQLLSKHTGLNLLATDDDHVH